MINVGNVSPDRKRLNHFQYSDMYVQKYQPRQGQSGDGMIRQKYDISVVQRVRS